MTGPVFDPDGPPDLEDEGVLAAIAALFAVTDPVPPGLADEVCLRLAVRQLDADLAALEQTDQLAGIRSTEYERAASLTFSVGAWSMLVTVTPLDGTVVRLDGWITGSDGAEIELRERARSSTTAARDGRFAFPRVERGLIQFLVCPTAPGARRVITPHVEV